MTSVTYTNLNKLLLIRDIQEIAKLISMMIEVSLDLEEQNC